MLWKLQFEPFLTIHDLHGHVDGNNTAPPKLLDDGAPNPLYLTWRRKDQIVLGLIVSSVSESVLHNLVGVATAHGAWTALASAYGFGSPSLIRSLKLQLYDLRQNSDKMVDYLQLAKTIHDRLLALGSAIPDHDFVQLVLRGLGPSYRPFIRSLHNRTVPVTFLELHGLLITEELDLSSDEMIGNPMAHYSNRSPNYRGRGFRRGRGRSSSPTQYGRSSNSMSRGAAYNTSRAIGESTTMVGHTQSSRPMICFNCQEAGHHFKFCPSPRKPSTSLPPVAHFTSAASQPTPIWTLDSGANHHLTNDLTNLSLHSEYQGRDQVQLSDGNHVPISHCGSSVMSLQSLPIQLRRILYVPRSCQNLLSIGALTRDNNISVTFAQNLVLIQDFRTRRMLFQGQSKDGLYPIPLDLFPNSVASQAHSAISLPIWHQLMGHANLDNVKRILRRYDLPLISQIRVFHQYVQTVVLEKCINNLFRFLSFNLPDHLI
ncbi:Retrovirus-related Pol polyprotein from transposon RE1 [Linum grandiflorum]